jgi:hypothetical protein
MMSCRFFYSAEERCGAVRAHVHGHCTVCGQWALNYGDRWTHVGVPCKPRSDGKWVALHGARDTQFRAGWPTQEAAA